MSVVMHLSRIRTDVEYLGNFMDYLTPKDFVEDENGISNVEKMELEHGRPEDVCTDAYSKWEAELIKSSWSDNKKHNILNYTEIRNMWGCLRGWHRMKKRLDTLPFKYFKGSVYMQKYIPIDEVAYRQGWFFKSKFFKKEMTWVICTTKEQMIHFFNQYIDYQGEDKRGKEAVEYFLNAWEDGMIFECVW